LATAVLRLDRISKQFGGFKALNDLSLEIFEGEILTLLGPSGCGKTTTLRILAGLETPDAGDLYLRDKPLVSVSAGICVPPDKRNMGMVFQSYAIWPHMTVFDNVAYPLRVRGVKSAEIRERVQHALELVGLSGLDHRQGPHLSGGQQQRVALARALVYEPSVLLMDEPFSNLDAKLREQMRVQVKTLLKRLTDITVIFVTHDQVEALSLSDRVVVMNNGQIEQLGSPRQLYERPATPFVRDFLGRTVLLRGTVQNSAAGQLSVQVDAAPGGTLTVRAVDDHPVAPGDAVYIAIRPEDIELRDADAPVRPNELVGTVEALLFVGEHFECRIRLGEAESVVLYAPRSKVLEEGQSVRLGLAADGVSLWQV
jgi:ABC-type Fe3+/spermidine/putrescine transport system ATPase subunit